MPNPSDEVEDQRSPEIIEEASEPTGGGSPAGRTPRSITWRGLLVVGLLIFLWHFVLTLEISQKAGSGFHVNPFNNLVKVDRGTSSTSYDLTEMLFQQSFQSAVSPALERELQLKARKRFDVYAMLLPYRVYIEADDPRASLEVSRASTPPPQRRQAPARPEPEWFTPETSIRISDVSVQPLSAKVAKVDIVESITGQRSTSRDEFLLVRIAIRLRDPNSKTEYEPWGSHSSKATLEDDFGNSYELQHTGLMSFEKFRGSVTSETALYPEETLEDLLVFERPLETVSYLRLELPGKHVGVRENYRFQLPADFLER